MKRTQAAERPREYCGLCGVYGVASVLEKAHLGLHSLQHRGQEAAGVMVAVGDRCHLRKELGLVDEVFGRLPAAWWGQDAVTHAIGHVRYSTAGASVVTNAQPLMAEVGGQMVGVAHNGTICNARSLREELQADGVIFQTTTDTELVLHLMARGLKRCRGDLWNALTEALLRLRGAYSLLLMTRDHLVAVRDPHGFRPLNIGTFADGGYMVASETIAFTVAGARYLREVDPGELLIWGPANQWVSRRFGASARKAYCIFEHVYFARPGSYVFGDSVYEVRREMGRQLARECPVQADVIVPVPDSGIYAGLGYAEQSGIPFDMGISRNHYVGRTFIDPGLTPRGQQVMRKMQPIGEALRGKRVCLIEDSIVRGSTSLARIRALRDVGAREVHMRVSCPPHRHGCFFGIDFPQREELLANRHGVGDLAKYLDLDSLGYLSERGMLGCVRAHPPEEYCVACFSGDYPVCPERLDAPPEDKRGER